jgi:hypothetical protein
MVNYTPFGPVTTSNHHTLPVRPIPPALPSHGSQLAIHGVEIQLPALAVTRSGHRFRATATPFVPSAGLAVIAADSESYDSDEPDASLPPSPPAAPQKGPAPSHRFSQGSYIIIERSTTSTCRAGSGT